MPKKSLKKTTVLTTTAKASGRGGARPGAGRPKGTGKFGAPTKAVRLPIHLIDKVMVFVQKELAAEKKTTK